MLAIKVPPEIEERLSELAAKAGRSREDIAREALLTYLEDMEDAFIAIERLKEGGRRIPLDEVIERYKSERVD